MSDLGLKGFALGMMALSLAESGKASAREVLDSAFDCARAAVREQPGRNHRAFSTSRRLRPFCCRWLNESTRSSSTSISGGASRCDSRVRLDPRFPGRAAQTDVQLAMCWRGMIVPLRAL